MNTHATLEWCRVAKNVEDDDTIFGLHFPTPASDSQVQADPSLKEKAWHLTWMPLAFLALTSRASVAQLVRARDCQSLGRRFDSV